LGDLLGVGDWVTFEPEMSLDGDSGATVKVAAAFCRWGRAVLEVIEPLEGETAIFTDSISPERTLAFHHVGVRVEDLAAARDASARAGSESVVSGHFEDQIEFAFVDARATMGHYLELVQFSEAGWGLIAGILGDGPEGAAG